MKRWFCRILSRGKQAISSSEMLSFLTAFLFAVVKKMVSALFTCVLALGGAIVGTIIGAIKGQTTESGLTRGAGVGAVTGAITALHLLDSFLNGEPFSKVALLKSLVNGKVFMEWVSPAVLKAYQWQVSSTESSFREISDIFEVTIAKGLSQDSIKRLPNSIFPPLALGQCHELSCAICLQDFKSGDSTRILPSCRHAFHLGCVDEWLARQSNCPMCREDV